MSRAQQGHNKNRKIRLRAMEALQACGRGEGQAHMKCTTTHVCNDTCAWRNDTCAQHARAWTQLPTVAACNQWAAGNADSRTPRPAPQSRSPRGSQRARAARTGTAGNSGVGGRGQALRAEEQHCSCRGGATVPHREGAAQQATHLGLVFDIRALTNSLTGTRDPPTHKRCPQHAAFTVVARDDPEASKHQRLAHVLLRDGRGVAGFCTRWRAAPQIGSAACSPARAPAPCPRSYYESHVKQGGLRIQHPASS